MFSQFSSLPHDLQKEILSSSGSILQHSLCLNKRYYQLLLPIALKQLGEQEISVYNGNDEVGWFLNDHSVPLYLWTEIYENCMTSSIRIDFGNSFCLISINHNSSYQLLRDTNFDILRNFNKGAPIRTLTDVSTYFKVAKRRLSCVKANPDYAKIMTHRYLEAVIGVLAGNDFKLYCYLLSHIWIFNLDFPNKRGNPTIYIDDKGIPLPGEMQKPEILAILNNTELLIRKIRHMIDALE